MTPEQERWGFAAKLREMHGDRVGNVLLERHDAMVEAGDADGVAFWLDIAWRVLALKEAESGDRPN